MFEYQANAYELIDCIKNTKRDILLLNNLICVQPILNVFVSFKDNVFYS